jgi:hypothetical protein
LTLLLASVEAALQRITIGPPIAAAPRPNAEDLRKLRRVTFVLLCFMASPRNRFRWYSSVLGIRRHFPFATYPTTPPVSCRIHNPPSVQETQVKKLPHDY